jgi:hypothetical protein
MKILIDKDIKQSLIKRYWKDTRKALVKSRQLVIDKSEHVDPERLKGYVKDLLNPAPVKEQILDIWGSVGGKYANDTSRKLKLKNSVLYFDIKADDLTLWKERMRKYAYERSLQKVQSIMDTQEQLINTVIDGVLEKVTADGLGIPAARELMKNSLTDETLLEIENYQAERIARTEVNGASNAGSYEGAQDSGLDMKKIWIHGGGMTPGYRPEHVAFAEMEPQPMDYEYAVGLQYPCDENADPDQICNCRCAIGYEVD